MCTAYKIYAEVIKNRIEKELEENDMVPESQTDFKRINDGLYFCIKFAFPLFAFDAKRKNTTREGWNSIYDVRRHEDGFLIMCREVHYGRNRGKKE